MKKIIAALIIIAVTSPAAYGASSKPTPKPVVKVGPVKKATAVKKPIKKKIYSRKSTKVAAKPKTTPKPVWPPKGFKENNGVFARVPSGAELVGLLSSKKTLAKTVLACEASACGAVYIASATDCLWWEVNATVFGPSYSDITNYVPYGNVRILLSGTSAHTISPVFLVSNEPLIPNEALILQTIGIKKDKFYNLISKGQSLRQIAGAKINAVVGAVTSAERKDIADRLASGAITEAQSQAELEVLPAKISNELTSYNLNVGGINVKCWLTAPTEAVPSTTYTPALTR